MWSEIFLTKRKTLHLYRVQQTTVQSQLFSIYNVLKRNNNKKNVSRCFNSLKDNHLLSELRTIIVETIWGYCLLFTFVSNVFFHTDVGYTLTISIWRVMCIPIWQFVQLTDNLNMGVWLIEDMDEGAWGVNIIPPFAANAPAWHYAWNLFYLTIYQKSYLSARQILQLNICYNLNCILTLCIWVHILPARYAHSWWNNTVE